MKSRYIQTLVFILITFFAFSSAPDTVRHVVYFDVDQHQLTEHEKGLLEDFLDRQKVDNQCFIRLTAHTDSDASDEYNEELSQHRLNTIEEQLKVEGISDKIVYAEAFGETKPLNRNTNNTDKAKNRRVEIECICHRKAPFAPENANWFFDEEHKKPTVFTLLNNKDTLLHGDDGTIVSISPSLFGSDNTGVQIRLTEYYSLTDMVLHNLTTSSNGDLLETAGMIDIHAFKDGKEVQPEGTVNILFPRNEPFEGGEIFNGEWNDAHDHVNWQQDNLASLKPLIAQTNIDNCLRGIYNFWDYRFSADCNWWCRLMFKLGIRKSSPNLNRTLGVSSSKKWDLTWTNPDSRPCLKDLTEIEQLNTRYANEIKALGAKDYIEYRYKQDSIYKENAAKVFRQRKDALDVITGTSTKEITDGNAEMAMNYMVASVTKFGTINCDRFKGQNWKKDNEVYDIGDHQGATSVKLIFHRIKSMMNGQSFEGKAYFKGIPRGKVVTLLVIKYVGGKILMASQKFKTGEQPRLEFKPVEKGKLKERISSISSKIW